MLEALMELNEEQIKFICDVCHITEYRLFSFDEDELYDRVYDVMCDIEIAETPSGEEKMSKRCELAESIVTILGNGIEDEDELPGKVEYVVSADDE